MPKRRIRIQNTLFDLTEDDSVITTKTETGITLKVNGEAHDFVMPEDDALRVIADLAAPRRHRLPLYAVTAAAVVFGAAAASLGAYSLYDGFNSPSIALSQAEIKQAASQTSTPPGTTDGSQYDWSDASWARLAPGAKIEHGTQVAGTSPAPKTSDRAKEVAETQVLIQAQKAISDGKQIPQEVFEKLPQAITNGMTYDQYLGAGSHSTKSFRNKLTAEYRDRYGTPMVFDTKLLNDSGNFALLPPGGGSYKSIADLPTFGFKL